MEKSILAGCDLHDRSMLVVASFGSGEVRKKTVSTTPAGRKSLLKWLTEWAAGAHIIFAYEASALGFGLHDELVAKGVTCHVLAPSKLARSPKQVRNKTDEKDARDIHAVLRGHYLAGNPLPSIWIPDPETRDHRELVRARIDAQEKCSAVKTQIRCLLKRNALERPSGEGWTKVYRNWLKDLSECDAPLASGARSTLASLLRQMNLLEEEVKLKDQEITALTQRPRFAKSAKALMELAGVGALTAMVFLTEMGDLSRFKNRRQIGSFLGLVPSAYESGEASDRKGRITRQGPARVRYVLCQAAWNSIRGDPRERATYDRIASKNPKRKKKALVATMRRLAIRMWHVAQAA
jgi:transposase